MGEHETIRDILRQAKLSESNLALFGDEELNALAKNKFLTVEGFRLAHPGAWKEILPERVALWGLLSNAFGTPADQEGGTQVHDDHPMSKFVDCLRERSLQDRINNTEPGSMIALPTGTVWLGDRETFSNELFVRPCYFELLDAKKKYFELDQKLTAVVYTGTPGIGKSHLCAFVVARKLIAGTVVYFEAVAPSKAKNRRSEFFRLDLKRGVLSLDSFQALHQLPGDANAVYIVDGGLGSSACPILEVQIFASPTTELFVPQTKSWNYLYLHTPLLSLEELEKCRLAVTNFKKITAETLERWFMVAGPTREALVHSIPISEVKDMKSDVLRALNASHFF